MSAAVPVAGIVIVVVVIVIVERWADDYGAPPTSIMTTASITMSSVMPAPIVFSGVTFVMTPEMLAL
jgi:hypothetical protein